MSLRPQAFTFVLGLALIGLTSSCSTLSSANMVPEEVEVQNLHSGSVQVQAKGSERSITGRRAISTVALQQAVVDAMESTRLFSEVSESSDSDYRLIVEVTELEKPELELDMEARLTCKWALVSATGQTSAWSDTISTHFVATTFDANFIEERGAMALEGVVRANVREALERISSLELPRSIPVQ